MFWDSSAVVPFLLPEAHSKAIASLLRSDREVVLWWTSPVECQSALYRRHRDEPLPSALLDDALRRLRALVEDADFIAPTTRVRDRAGRLLAAHPLRAADALQLAALTTARVSWRPASSRVATASSKGNGPRSATWCTRPALCSSRAGGRSYAGLSTWRSRATSRVCSA